MVEMECEACGEDCSNAYATFRGAPYHFSCMPMRNQLQAWKRRCEKAAGNPPTEVRLSVNEWYNLLNALQTVVEHYGLAEVEAAIDHFKVTGKVGCAI